MKFVVIDRAKGRMSKRTRAIFPSWRDLSVGDWLFFGSIMGANVVPWGLLIWGLTQ